MSDYLKRYKFEIQTVGPLYIGSGKKLLKKEWILDTDNKMVEVIDIYKFFKFIEGKGLTESYEKFVINDKRGLYVWIKDNNIKRSDIQSFTAYNLSHEDVQDLKTSKEIETIIKDSYGCPYIPGSSLKGAIRNALLAYTIEKDGIDKKYGSKLKNQIGIYEKNSKKYLRNIADDVNDECFNTLNFDEKKHKSAVNDRLRGLRISDSKPLSIKDVILCQKVDIDEEGQDFSLPILRECIKQNTKIEFTLTIDSFETDITIDEITSALNQFIERYNENYLKKFETEELYNSGHIYLGGGVGFPSKTSAYQLLGNEKYSYKDVDKIIDNTMNEKQRKNRHTAKRNNVKVSPHVCKLTFHNNDYYQMGICKYSITSF